MKNSIVLASLVAAFVALTGCAHQCHSSCGTEQAAPAHHDLKGEVSGK